jgi:aryl-alcohol dehydrogenase-like predicted oxidoreductase
MKYVEAGGVRVSAIGLGTWQFASGEWAYGDDYAATIAPALVRRALEVGITLIDTAEAYGGGGSELIVGSALRDAARDPFVATKFTPLLPVASVMASHAEQSRRRLNVAAIDLYQLHFANPVVPVARQASGLRRVLDLGIARHVGVSNHSLKRWRAIEGALGRPVLSNQVEFNLGRSHALRHLVPYAVENDRLVIAYSPLGQGILAESRKPRRNRARLIRRAMGAPSWKRVAPLRAVIAEVAAAHDATMAQVALAWLIAQPNVVAIPGARTLEQLEENARAADLELTTADVERLTAASAAIRGG